MTSFDQLLDDFATVKNEDRSGFIIGKADTLSRYSKAYPELHNIVRAFIFKIVSVDGDLSLNEYALIRNLATYKDGSVFDPDEFKESIAKFVFSGADVTKAEEEYKKLPEYVKDDIIMLLFSFAVIDGKLDIDEVQWLSSLTE